MHPNYVQRDLNYLGTVISPGPLVLQLMAEIRPPLTSPALSHLDIHIIRTNLPPYIFHNEYAF